MAMKPTRAGDVSAADTHCKFLIQGDSGAGKSRIGASMPKPAILLCEANGLATIRRRNPDAMVFLAYDPVQYGFTSSYEVVAEFMRMAHSGELKAMGCESVVADSGTEVQRIIRDQILRERGALGNPAYQFTQPDWGQLTERMRRFGRSFRDVPMHALMITLSMTEKDEDGNVTILPAFEGKKLCNEVTQFFTAAGYAFKRTRKMSPGDGKPEVDVVSHHVLFQGPSKYLVKPVEPLLNVEEPDAAMWIAKITAEPVGPEVAAEAAAQPTEAAAPVTPPDAKPTQPNKPAGSTQPVVTTRRSRGSASAKQQDIDPTN